MLRRSRRSVGAALAALFLLAAALPGLAAAAQGVQLQAPICTPDGAIPADTGGAPLAAGGDHCQICPLGPVNEPALPEQNVRIFPAPDRSPAVAYSGADIGAGARAELSPLRGRAPPYRS